MMMELSIGLLLAGGLVALLIPLIAMQRDQDANRKDTLALQQARDALLGQAVIGGGLPAPIKFAESTINSATVFSHLTLSSDTLPLGFAGALPGSALGVPSISSVQTAFWYDVQPALRADANKGFFPLLKADNLSFEPIIKQFDPALNSNLSTGGNKTQLCRNLNSLQNIEQSIRLKNGNYTRDLLYTTLPRVWGSGFESQFTWNSPSGYADVASATNDSTFENSAAAAFVVVMRQPPALRRLDRQNTVYAHDPATGLDLAVSGSASATSRPGFRVYENPNTAAIDNPTVDTSDYAGVVRSVSLGEFAQSLRKAGMCTTPPAACKANELFVRFSNNVRSAPVIGVTEGLRMRWKLVNNSSTGNVAGLESGELNYGTSTEGICLEAFSTDTPTALIRNLRLFFVSPAGTEGYVSGDAWYRNDPLVHVNGTPWLPLAALSAANADKTVTIACTGSHKTTANSPTGELMSDVVPTCSVTQLP
jgi:hypothetical protein